MFITGLCSLGFAHGYVPGQQFYDVPMGVPAAELEHMDMSMVKEKELVFVLHGIGKAKFDMAIMAHGLRQAGYGVVNWSYPSTRHSLTELADLLAAEIQPFQDDYTIHFVTHSMGGIVVRTYLSRYELDNLGRIVMVAPPSQGAELAQFFGSWGLYKSWFGPAGQELRPGQLGACANAGVPGCEFGIIAGGTGGPIGINPLLPGDNDGTVTVESTRLEGASDFAILPYPHPVIQMMPQTIELSVHFLEEGNFGRHSAWENHEDNAAAGGASFRRD